MKTIIASCAAILFCAAECFAQSPETIRCGTLDGSPAVEIPLGAEPTFMNHSAVNAASAVPTGPPMRQPDMDWVESTLSSLTLEEKIGQMMILEYPLPSNAISTYKIGGAIFLGNNNTASAILANTNNLQAQSPIPLIFAIDCECGLGARVTDATRFPYNMAMGACDQPELARLQGKVTARECRSVGVQIGFGPCVDVNTEPINPIIGVRSFGDRPDLVAELAEAYVQGANSEGLLCTYKHFPGHGATTGDSHNSLPVVTVPYSEILAKHVAPYSALLANGTVDLVMSAHVWYTALDPGTTAWPATLSSNALTSILRQQLGYTGAVISDSYGMAGISEATDYYNAGWLGISAGLDIILMPPASQIATIRSGIENAVQTGQLTMDRIDASVRRMLILKSRAGIPEVTTNSTAVMTATMKHPDNLAVATQIAQNCISSIRVNSGDVPIPTGDKVLIVDNGSSGIFYSYSTSYFRTAFASLVPQTTVYTLPSNLTTSVKNSIITQAQASDRVIYLDGSWLPTLSSSRIDLINSLQATGVPLVFANLGSPYKILQVPGIENYFCTFCSHFDSQQQLAKVLVGQATAEAKWPVAIQGVVSAKANDWNLFY
jgi:beta-N-acetylhexosaminidase